MDLFTRTTQIELLVDAEAKVETLWPLFQNLIEKVRPSLLLVEELFKTLFVEKRSLLQKLVELSKILIAFKIELKTLIIGKSKQTLFEIRSHYEHKKLSWVRVVHYSFDGLYHQLTQVILV